MSSSVISNIRFIAVPPDIGITESENIEFSVTLIYRTPFFIIKVNLLLVLHVKVCELNTLFCIRIITSAIVFPILIMNLHV